MGLNILIADDNCDAVDTLARLVGFWGHDARVAYDGLGALHEARRYPFDVGLFDVGMPNLDGYGLARQLRQEQTVDEAFLIAITAYSGKEFERLSASAGFDLHLVKPVAPQLLRQGVSQALCRWLGRMLAGMNVEWPVPTMIFPFLCT